MFRGAGKTDAVSVFQVEEANKKVDVLEAQLKGDVAGESQANVNLTEILPAKLAAARAQDRQAETQIRQSEDALAGAEARASKRINSIIGIIRIFRSSKLSTAL